ncbi:hypothetical protein ACQ7DA_11510 [Zafaria sp. J156]|uniref:hypothetical protein n=1 Tax=Zafaria sp. J156 TaxID=3116490 RepID=UPI002E78F097|nr:hypothetical protein [Zafaria sp. J156]MEE1621772.1 hypothetical protein [Zafaria sp. J156]
MVEPGGPDPQGDAVEALLRESGVPTDPRLAAALEDLAVRGRSAAPEPRGALARLLAQGPAAGTPGGGGLIDGGSVPDAGGDGVLPFRRKGGPTAAGALAALVLVAGGVGVAAATTADRPAPVAAVVVPDGGQPAVQRAGIDSAAPVPPAELPAVPGGSGSSGPLAGSTGALERTAVVDGAGDDDGNGAEPRGAGPKAARSAAFPAEREPGPERPGAGTSKAAADRTSTASRGAAEARPVRAAASSQAAPVRSSASPKAPAQQKAQPKTLQQQRAAQKSAEKQRALQLKAAQQRAAQEKAAQKRLAQQRAAEAAQKQQAQRKQPAGGKKQGIVNPVKKAGGVQGFTVLPSIGQHGQPGAPGLKKPGLPGHGKDQSEKRGSGR